MDINNFRNDNGTLSLPRLLKHYGYWETLKENGYLPYIKGIKLRVNSNLTSCLGRANLNTERVEFAPRILENDAQFSDTLIHEVCHIIASRKWNERGHGKIWKNLMRMFGAVPFARVSKTQVEHAYSRRKKAPSSEQVIHKVVNYNPKRKGSKSADRFNIYEDGLTVSAFLSLGGTKQDLQWDIKHEFIEVRDA